eukprot:gnl/TRDRNA2_/TRDRNA2_170863_c0_seq3.p1 gnl/TRDRNA2_/TRDRNA2_170863_c0~~gnl/TRDRNA2_/TRDRNA2_170863_c0_seq3.p1  ORF type:complete len:214 (+),score=21.66 gnl/TRDRNA2_/TRDRNA2_170863_c0_seq3:72-713(+)
MVSLLVQYPYIFYPCFIIIFMSPLNKPEPFRKIPVRKVWRTILYLAGCVMGSGYFVAGLVAAIYKPFTEESCGTSDDVWYLQLYIYSTLMPVGLLMGLFHIAMARARLGAKEGEGSTIGNGRVVLACCSVQAVWLAIWYSWLSTATTLCEAAAFDRGALGTTLGITCFSSCIIGSILLVRLGVFLFVGCDCDKFDEAYCGGAREDDQYTKVSG